MWNFGVFLVFVACGLANAAKVPKGWKTCKADKNLNACLKDAIQKVVPYLVQGIPSLGVHKMDPLHFESLSIGRGQNHPVDLDLDFKDFDILGIKDAQVKSIETDWKVMKAEVFVPKMRLVGKYKVNGKVLVLPVTGDGDVELAIDNFKGHLVLKIGEKPSGGKTYYHIENIDVTFDGDLLKLRFDNLFNGDKRLGDQMNIFVNENWKELLNELGPPIGKSLALACTEIGNRVFSKIPKDLITPP